MKFLNKWLLIAIGSHLLLFIERSEGISLYELLFTIIFYPSLLIWFFYKWWFGFAIIQTKSDLSIFMFLIFGFISIFISYIYGGDLIKGLREWILFTPYLLFFPLRDYIIDLKRFRNVLLIIITVGSFVSLINIVKYYTSLGYAEYLYEIWGRRQALEESLYMSSIILGITLLSVGERPKYFLFISILLNMTSLAFTFSRGYWIATSTGIILIILLSEWKIKKQLFRWGIIATLLILIFIITLFPNLYTAIREGIIIRLTSIGYGDISLQARFIESRTILNLILLNPILGSGFGSLYSFYDLILQHYKNTWYIHNGYLFILFKVGILGFIFYFWFYFSKTVTLFKSMLIIYEKKIKSIMSGLMVVPIIMLLLSFSSPQFYDRASILVLTIVWGAAEGLKNRIKS